MEYDCDKKEIILGRTLSDLDKFVLDFLGILERHLDYVVVSGYVSILLGRSRATEDVDLLVPEMSEEKFKNLWDDFCKEGFECMNTSNILEALDMLKGHAIRFFRGKPLPNIEFKKMKNKLDIYSFKNRWKVKVDGREIYISPIELQIAYKLFLGSGKDLEDAKHLYDLFKERLDKEKLVFFIDKLKVNDKFKIIDTENGNRFRTIE